MGNQIGKDPVFDLAVTFIQDKRIGFKFTDNAKNQAIVIMFKFIVPYIL